MQACAACRAVVQALEVGSAHACSAAVISDLQSMKQLNSVVLALRRQLCSVVRQPVTQAASTGGGVAVTHVALHV